MKRRRSLSSWFKTYLRGPRGPAGPDGFQGPAGPQGEPGDSDLTERMEAAEQQIIGLKNRLFMLENRNGLFLTEKQPRETEQVQTPDQEGPGTDAVQSDPEAG